MISSDNSREVLAARTLFEQEWSYSRHLEHMPYRMMRDAAALPVELGGLGHPLSQHTLRRLVADYIDSQRDVVRVNRDEYIARELNDLDGITRHAAAALARAEHEGRLDDRAATVFLKAAERRARLLGLDAPVEARLDVTVNDAATVELNAMLAEAGIGPVESS